MGRGLHEFNVNASVFVPSELGEGIEGRQRSAIGAFGPPLRSEAAEFVPRWQGGGSPHVNGDSSGLDAAPAPEASPQLSADAVPFVPAGSAYSTRAATKVAPESSFLVGGAEVQWPCKEKVEWQHQQQCSFAKASQEDSAIGEEEAEEEDEEKEDDEEEEEEAQEGSVSDNGFGWWEEDGKAKRWSAMAAHSCAIGGGSSSSTAISVAAAPAPVLPLPGLASHSWQSLEGSPERLRTLQEPMESLRWRGRSKDDVSFRRHGAQLQEDQWQPAASESALGRHPQVSRSMPQRPPLRRPPPEPCPRASRQFRTDAEEFVPQSRRALPDTSTAAVAHSMAVACSAADADGMACTSARRSGLPQMFDTSAPGLGGIQQVRPQRGRSPQGAARVASGLNPDAEAYRPRAGLISAPGQSTWAAPVAKQPGGRASLRADAPVWEPPARLREEAARSSRAQSLQARGWTALRADAPSWEPPDRRGEEISLRGVRAQSLQVRGQGCFERSNNGCRPGLNVASQHGHVQTEGDGSGSEELVAQPPQLFVAPVSHELAAAQSVGAAKRLEPHRRWQLRRVSSMQPRARSEAAATTAAAGEGDSAEVHTMLPVDDLLWSHGDILDHFKDERSIYETVVQLMDGSLKPTDLPPLQVVMKEGKLVSLSNRRLWVLWKYQELLRKHASGSSQRPVVYAPVVFPKECESLQRKVARALSTHNGGQSVELRRCRFAHGQQAMVIDAAACNGLAPGVWLPSVGGKESSRVL